jgi:hypothetical protein
MILNAPQPVGNSNGPPHFSSARAEREQKIDFERIHTSWVFQGPPHFPPGPTAFSSGQGRAPQKTMLLDAAKVLVNSSGRLPLLSARAVRDKKLYDSGCFQTCCE